MKFDKNSQFSAFKYPNTRISEKITLLDENFSPEIIALVGFSVSRFRMRREVLQQAEAPPWVARLAFSARPSSNGYFSFEGQVIDNLRTIIYLQFILIFRKGRICPI